MQFAFGMSDHRPRYFCSLKTKTETLASGMEFGAVKRHVSHQLEDRMSEFVKKNTWVIPAVGFALLIVAGIAFS